MNVGIAKLSRMFQRAIVAVLTLCVSVTFAEEPATTPKAFVDGEGLGWRALGEKDFVNVNCDPGTWSWKDGLAQCTGKPVGVIRSTKEFTNLELVAQWRHLKSGGNSGIFLWATEEGMKDLKPNSLPSVGIEVQVLDHGYAEQYEKSTGKKPDWFTTHGDVFPVGKSTMNPFPPIAPKSQRSFPRKNLSKGIGEWNHYYVRAINGEVRLWLVVPGRGGLRLPLPGIGRLASRIQEFANSRTAIILS